MSYSAENHRRGEHIALGAFGVHVWLALANGAARTLRCAVAWPPRAQAVRSGGEKDPPALRGAAGLGLHDVAVGLRNGHNGQRDAGALGVAGGWRLLAFVEDDAGAPDAVEDGGDIGGVDALGRCGSGAPGRGGGGVSRGGSCGLRAGVGREGRCG